MDGGTDADMETQFKEMMTRFQQKEVEFLPSLAKIPRFHFKVPVLRQNHDRLKHLRSLNREGMTAGVDHG